MQVIEAENRLAAEFEQDVATYYSGTRGRPVRLHIRDEYGVFDCASQSAHDASIERDRLSGDFHTPTSNSAVTHQLSRQRRCDIDADCETDSLRAADDRRVDSDNAAVAVDKRA